MRRTIRVLIPTLAISMLVAACGSSSSKNAGTNTSTASTGTAAAQSSSSGPLVKTASNSKLGETVLVDAQGMTLYSLSAEHGGKFICTSSCEQLWHPLAAQAGASPSGTVGSLSTVKRPDGTMQVAYKGLPLYTFAQDTAPGQANGQGFKDVGTWSAATTSGGASPPAATTNTGESGAAESGGGYHY